ncbi:MAG: HD-GYP domain-containing protein [Gammaproteobacteria bacterium]|nr:HD-GYP domain-containing protein [Gammaproteobacteria bacterium]
MINIRKTLVIRLFWTWLGLSSLTAGLVYYFETERVDEKVLALAVAAEQQLSVEQLRGYNQGEVSAAQIKAIAEELGRGRFAVVEIYDRHKQKIVELVGQGREELEHALSAQAHAFPLGEEIRYEKYWVLDEFVLMVLLPLRDQAGQLQGYFEGVFVADAETVAQIQQDVLSSVLIAMGVILVTTLVLYPVILSLNRELIENSRKILRANLELLEVLGSAIAKRDSDTNIHNYRVTLYAIALGEAVAMSGEELRRLIVGAFLHDVGKIGISDNILLKPGRLSEDEFRVMQQHVNLGIDIINRSSWLAAAEDVVLCHHEKFNGSGYPRGLKGEEIPRTARVFAIVDVFDALTSRRPYKEPFPFERAMQIIQEDAGSHFDPELVARFSAFAREIHRILSEADEEAIMAMLSDKSQHYFRF